MLLKWRSPFASWFGVRTLGFLVLGSRVAYSKSTWVAALETPLYPSSLFCTRYLTPLPCLAPSSPLQWTLQCRCGPRALGIEQMEKKFWSQRASDLLSAHPLHAPSEAPSWTNVLISGQRTRPARVPGDETAAQRTRSLWASVLLPPKPRGWHMGLFVPHPERVPLFMTTLGLGRRMNTRSPRSGRRRQRPHRPRYHTSPLRRGECALYQSKGGCKT